MTRVLVVEDSATDFESILGHMGAYDVVRAKSMEEARRCEDYDAVVLDLGLPDSSGLETVQKMLAATAAPIIVHSITGHDDLVRQALHAGCADYIVKGSAVDVQRAISHAMERASQGDILLRESRKVGRIVHQLAEAWDEDAEAAALVMDFEGRLKRATKRGQAKLEQLHLDLEILMSKHGGRIQSGHATTDHGFDWDLLLTTNPRDPDEVFAVFMQVEIDETEIDMDEAHHHFRTPLTPIMVDLALLSDPGGRHVDRIKDNLKRLQDYAASFVDYHGVRAQSLRLHREDFDLIPLLRDAFPALDGPARLAVIGDPHRVEALCDYLQSLAPASVSAAMQRDIASVTVRVEDWQGPPAAELVRPYAHQTKSDPGGLAIPLAREILEQLGGGLTVASDGDALEFRFWLPAQGDLGRDRR